MPTHKECSTKISVVICTFNRSKHLLECLKSFENIQTSISWELVVVNNNSSDETQSIIDKFCTHTSLRLVSGFEPNKGLSFARNNGVLLARGKYIAFTDDDCYPHSDYISAIYNSFQNNRGAGFIGGRVLLFDQNDLPITIQTFNEKLNFSKHSFLDAGVIHGANFIFNREALISAGMFDTRLGAGTKFPSEDVDILAEILRIEWLGFYDPSIVIYHHHRRKTQSDRETLQKNYDWGRGAYYAKRIFKPGQRWLYLKNWAKKMRRQPLSVTGRELAAAVLFLSKGIITR